MLPKYAEYFCNFSFKSGHRGILMFVSPTGPYFNSNLNEVKIKMAAKFLIGYSTPTVKSLRFSSPSPLDYALERVPRYKRFSLVF